MNERERQELLQAIVALGRAIFGAKACSIMRFDAATDELVFAAVAGEGEDTLVGRRIPSRTGVAGWVLHSEEAIAIEDVLHDPRFARDVAESTGYVPKGLTVFPLLHDEHAHGVLNVLDRGAGGAVGLADLEVLARLARLAAQALVAVEQSREAESDADDELTRLGRALGSADPARRDAAHDVLAALRGLLDA
jgi:GAF domain-containing protein